MAFFEDLRELRQQGLQLRARFSLAARIDQARMAGRLTQAQQRLQDLDLGPPDAVARDARQKRLPVMVLQLVVDAALIRFHVAENRLLGPRRQVARDLLFCASQEKGLESPSQDSAMRLGTGLGRRSEELRAPEHAGIQKLQQTPELA